MQSVNESRDGQKDGRFCRQMFDCAEETAGDREERTELPSEMSRETDGNIWSLLKNCIGKELTRVSIPVRFNEPLSFLQRLCEQLEYSHLLFQAERSDDLIGRLELIAAFTVSAASSNWDRLRKPFNPLLGETFELDRSEDRGFRMACEQVCHHPPISAFHAEATDGSWRFHGSVNPKLTFWGKSIEIEPRGDLTLEFPRRGEAFTWRNVACKIHNVIVGKMWIENFGNSVITCHSNGYRVELNWHLASWRNSDHHRVDGYILDAKKTKLKALYGKWLDAFFSVPLESWKTYKTTGSSKLDLQQRKRNSPSTSFTNIKSSSSSDGATVSSDDQEQQTSTQQHQLPPTGSKSISLGYQFLQRRRNGTGGEAKDENDAPSRGRSSDLDLPGQTLLWRVEPRPANSERYYGFTRFAMQLNRRPEEVKAGSNLPSTDCRRKPDIRALEAGDEEAAQAEKTRLEERQRRRLQQSPGAASSSSSSSSGPASPGGVWFQPWRNPYTRQEGDWLFGGDYCWAGEGGVKGRGADGLCAGIYGD